MLDEDNRYSDTIGPEGGQLVTLDAAGNTYTLTVPKGALGFPEQLSMTPLSDLKGMPFKKGLNVGVQLEPEGTFFVKKTFPLKFSVDVPKHEDAGGGSFDETWHLDLTVMHTPWGNTR